MTKIRGHIETYICNLLAQDKNPREVSQLLQDSQRISITSQTIRKFSQEKEPIIERIRQELSEKMLKRYIPIASETTRMEREEALYQLSQSLKQRTERIDYGLRCLGAAREECKSEKKDSTPQNVQFNQYNILTDEQLLFKKRELEKSIIALSKKGDGSYGKESGT